MFGLLSYIISKKVEETRNIAVSRSVYFEILNRLGLDHDCDGQWDGPTERPLAIARSNMNIELDAC